MMSISQKQSKNQYYMTSNFYFWNKYKLFASDIDIFYIFVNIGVPGITITFVPPIFYK